MAFLRNLKLRLSPPKMVDPDFGKLVFQFISEAPARSHWEAAEWTFPSTGTVIFISLPGGDQGPMPQAREFYLSLPGRYEQIIATARPRLAEVFQQWLRQDLPEDIFTVVKLTGFGLDDPTSEPVNWDISFETTGKEWLGITVPFIGEEAQEAVVDC